LAQPKIQNNATVEQVATGYKFLEGPLWVNGLGLLFSDIQGNTVYLRSASTQAITPYFTPSGGGNGSCLDPQGNLLLAQQNKRTVARIVKGVETTVAATYEGKKLNSPNDIVLKSSGSAFFTDPPYGINASQEELGYYGIFRLSPSGKLKVLDKTLKKPNGIAFSPDESKLYVSNTEEKIIYSWDVVNDSTLSNKQVFFKMNYPASGGADGMTVDDKGYLYCSGPLGIWVISPNKTIVDTILVPGQVTNCAFGDADGMSLYVTAGTSLYRVRNKTITSVDESVSAEAAILGQNYPNPFHETTMIPLELKESGHVRLEIKDRYGKQVALLAEGAHTAGVYEYAWHSDGLGSGIYILNLRINNRLYTKLLMVD
jgi:gluconolactonase